MDYYALLRRHQGYLERVALAILGNRAHAEDALQEAALACYQHFGQLQGGEAAFLPWLRQILVHRCSRILARRRRLLPVANPGAYPAAAVPGPDPEATAVWEMVARLDDRLRPVVVMHYLLDMTQPEIAAALGLPVGTVKSRLGRALALLPRMDDRERGPQR